MWWIGAAGPPWCCCTPSPVPAPCGSRRPPASSTRASGSWCPTSRFRGLDAPRGRALARRGRRDAHRHDRRAGGRPLHPGRGLAGRLPGDGDPAGAPDLARALVLCGTKASADGERRAPVASGWRAWSRTRRTTRAGSSSRRSCPDSWARPRVIRDPPSSSRCAGGSRMPVRISGLVPARHGTASGLGASARPRGACPGGVGVEDALSPRAEQDLMLERLPPASWPSSRVPGTCRRRAARCGRGGRAVSPSRSETVGLRDRVRRAGHSPAAFFDQPGRPWPRRW